MMRLAFLPVLLAASLAQPVLAQREMNSANANPFDRQVRAMARPVADKGSLQDRREADRAMQYFVECTVSRKRPRERAMAFTRMAPGSDAYRSAGVALAQSECLPMGARKMSFSADLFRVALFSGLYERDFGKVLAPNFTGLAATNIAAEFDAPLASLPPMMLGLRRFGDCVARTAPGPVHLLLQTNVRSAQENAAWPAVQPALGSCLSGNGELKFSRAVLRGVLAEAMFKLRTAQRSSVGKGQAS